MGKTLVVLVSFMVIACGSDPTISNNQTSIPKVDQEMPSLLTDDGDVAMIVGEFYGDAEALHHATKRDVQSIEWAPDLGTEALGEVIGECVSFTDGTGNESQKVYLLQSFWQTATLDDKRCLVYHELGHCALKLAHTSPTSGQIMQPSIPPNCGDDWLNKVRIEFASSSVK